MADQESPLDRLYRILASISPGKWNNFAIDLDNPAGNLQKVKFFCEIFTGRLTNKDTGELTHIIVKVVPTHGLMNNYDEIYRNEICFYTNIFPALNKFQRSKKVKHPFNSVPNFIGGHLEDNKHFIVMEDIAAAEYNSLGRNIKFIDRKYLKLIFQVYARFHALSFVYKHENPKEFRSMTEELVDILKYMYSQGIRGGAEEAYLAAIDAFDEDLEADIVRRLKSAKNISISKNIFSNARDYDGKYTCLTHGNCLLGNMFFNFRDSQCPEDIKLKLIDFQLAYVGSPVHDLSNIFYTGASKSDLDELERYLEIYYDSFSNFVRELGADPVEIYPYEVLKAEWTKYSCPGLIIGFTTWLKKLLTDTDLKEIVAANALPLEEKRRVWRNKMSELKKVSVFRQRARDICLHAIEYGIL